MNKCGCKFWESCRTCKYPEMSDQEILKDQVLQLAEMLKKISETDANLGHLYNRAYDLVTELRDWK